MKKYSDPGIMQKAMGLLVIKNPYVVKTEKQGSSVCYTVEGDYAERSSEIPSDLTQFYKVCWESGRIKSLEFYAHAQASGGDHSGNAGMHVIQIDRRSLRRSSRI